MAKAQKQRQYIENIYKEMYEMLISYAKPKLIDEDLLEEAVQETFRIACQKPEDLMNSPNPYGWLVTTLKYVIKNMNRSRQSTARLLADYVAVRGEQITFTRDQHDVDFTFCGIADMDEFKLLKEMAVDGKSHLEMATDRGISVDACKKRVQRAKEVLKKKLK